jgi:hypothetical protein
VELVPAPITQQPGVMPQPIPGINWMPLPQGLENCPAGLEYLSMIDQLVVQQQVEALEGKFFFITKFMANLSSMEVSK